MTVPTHAERSPLDAGGALGRVRTSSLAVDIAVVSGVALVLGLIRLGAPSLWVDESYTARWADASYASYVEGYHWLYYSLVRPWTEVVGTGGDGPPFSVGHRRDARERARRHDRAQAVRPLGRARRGAADRVEPVRRQVVAAGARVHVPARPRRSLDAAVASCARQQHSTRLGAVRARVRRGDRLASGRRASSSCRRSSCSRTSGGIASSRTGSSPHSSSVALGVPWAAQIAMRSTGDGVAMNWLKFPSPEVAARAVVDVSGAAFGLALALAVAGLVLAGPGKAARCERLARDLGVRSVRPRSRGLDVPADLPRPLPDRRRTGLRAARGRRDHRSRSEVASGSCDGHRAGDDRWARALVRDRRKLAG